MEKPDVGEGHHSIDKEIDEGEDSHDEAVSKSLNKALLQTAMCFSITRCST